MLVCAQIDLEAYGRDVDFQQLQGLWRLIYTTALDVVCAFSSAQYATKGQMASEWSYIICAVILPFGTDASSLRHSFS